MFSLSGAHFFDEAMSSSSTSSTSSSSSTLKKTTAEKAREANADDDKKDTEKPRRGVTFNIPKKGEEKRKADDAQVQEVKEPEKKIQEKYH